MAGIETYFMNRLKDENINLDNKGYKDITQHLWSEDPFSKRIIQFIKTNALVKPKIYEADKLLLNAYLTNEMKERLKFQKIEPIKEVIGLITLDDLFRVSNNCSAKENEISRPNANLLIVAYMGIIIKNKPGLVCAYMQPTMYDQFDYFTELKTLQ